MKTYNKTIDSINGTIGIVKRYDDELGAYINVYLNHKCIGFIDHECTDKEIENFVQDYLSNVETDYPF